MEGMAARVGGMQWVGEERRVITGGIIILIILQFNKLLIILMKYKFHMYIYIFF